MRRRADPHEVYVDLFGLRDLLSVVIVLLLCILDAIFTLYHLNRGAEEMNLLMAHALSMGVGYFILIKYSVTAAGVLFLCVRKNFRFVREAFIGIISLYLLLIVYHILLF